MDETEFRWRQIIIPAFGPSLLFGIGTGAVVPVVALTAIDLRTSHAVAGLIVALVGFGSLVANIPAALITGRFGERRSLVAASIFSILALLLCVLARHAVVLALGVFMLGMASSVFLLARQTYMIDAVPLRLRARAFSTLGGTHRIGMFIGPFLAAAVMHFIDLPGAYWTAIATFSVAALLSYTIPDLNPAPKRSAAGTAQDRTPTIRMVDIVRAHYRVLLTIGMGVLFIGAMRASRQIAVPLWAEYIGLSPTATAVVFGLVSAIDVLVFYPAGKIMDEYGRLWVALPCALILGVSFLTIPWTSTLVPFVLVAAFMGLGNGIGSGIVMILGADAAPLDGRTQFLGLWRLISDLGTSTGPFFLSGMTALFSLGAGISAIGMLGFAAAAIFWRGLPHGRQSKKPA